MSCHDQKLDQQLKKLKEDTSWNEARRRQVQRSIQASIRDKKFNRELSMHRLRRWAPALLSAVLLFSFSIFLILGSTGTLLNGGASDSSSSSDARLGPFKVPQEAAPDSMDTLPKTGETPSEEEATDSDRASDQPLSGYVRLKISRTLNEKVNQLVQQGFPVDLPPFVPEKSPVLTDVVKNGPYKETGVTTILTSYAAEADADKMDQTFTITQETLREGYSQEDAEQMAVERYGTDDLKKVIIQSNPAYVYYTQQREQYDVFIVGRHYAYTLNSDKLLYHDLVMIATDMAIR